MIYNTADNIDLFGLFKPGGKCRVIINQAVHECIDIAGGVKGKCGYMKQVLSMACSDCKSSLFCKQKVETAVIDRHFTFKHPGKTPLGSHEIPFFMKNKT